MANKIHWIGYYGGKQFMIEWMSKYLPCNSQKMHLVDVFGGSATVALSLQSLFGAVTYNDIDSEIVNLFRVCREYPDELQRVLEYTPYSREEHYQSMDGIRKGFEAFSEQTGRSIIKHPLPEEEPKRSIEMARRYFVDTQMGFNYGKNASWSYVITAYMQRRRPPKVFNGKVSKIPEIVNKFREMQIECRTFHDILKCYDNEKVFFYCDPPYYADTRVSKKDYQYEMTHDQHVELLELLTQCKAKAMLSGYDCELYRHYLADWHKIEKDFVKKSSRCDANKKEQSIGTECLWINYDTGTDSNKLFNGTL